MAGTLETTPEQVRHLDEERARVPTKAGYELGRERVAAVVVQVIIVAGIESRSRTRRPAKQRLRSQPRVERVVVENQTREGGFRKLIRAAQCKNIDFECDAIRVVTFQSLAVDAETMHAVRSSVDN